MRVARSETTLPLDRQIEVAIPVVERRYRAAGRSDVQGEPISDVDRQCGSVGCNLRFKARRPGVAMVVAAVSEQRYRKMRRGPVSLGFEPPSEINGVGARFHPDPLLDNTAAEGKTPYRDS